MRRQTIFCQDKYEAQKLVGLIFVKESMETCITEILNVIENEIVLSVKDKSAHSVILKDDNEVINFRSEHRKNGRINNDVCKDCDRKGIGFKY